MRGCFFEDLEEVGVKDQLKFFGKLGLDRYFLEKRSMLISSCRLETTKQKKIDRERTKHELIGGFNYLFDLPWIYKITDRANWGKKDAKEDETKRARAVLEELKKTKKRR